MLKSISAFKFSLIVIASGELLFVVGGKSMFRSDKGRGEPFWGKTMWACSLFKRSRPHIPSYDEEEESKMSKD